jgi:uncharacterized protein
MRLGHCLSIIVVTLGSAAVGTTAGLAAGTKPLRPAAGVPAAAPAPQQRLVRRATPFLKTAPALRVPPAATAVADASITIMTEALPATAGSDEDSIGELARAYAAQRLPRVLPMRGLGPIANMRDLLHMRGIDMAVVNADILAYARIAGDLPGVETRLSAVAKLYDKTVYLVAAADVATVADLARRRVLVPGADSDSFVTARALLGTLAIPADLASSSLGDAIGELATGKAQALLLTLETDDATLATLPTGKGLHVLSIPETPALAKIYGRRSLGPGDANGLAPEGASTVTVASLLATFNWRPTQFRYGPVVQFVRALPSVVGSLRKSDPKGVWRQLDGRADVPGWPRYEPARPLLAALAADIAPATAPQDIVAVATAKAAATSTAAAKPLAAKLPPIEVAALNMAVLTDAKDAKGGLLTEIVTAGLGSETHQLEWLSGDPAVQDWLTQGATPRLGFPFARPDCAHAKDLAVADQALCDTFAFSKPIFQALQVFFVRHGSDFTFERDEQLIGRSICVPASNDLASLDAAGRRWIADDLVTLLRRPDLTACFAALDKGDVDAVFADDLTGRAALEKLRLDDKIEVVRRPVATIDLCAMAAKANPDAVAALQRLDSGIAAIQADGRYASIVLGRLGQSQLSGEFPAVQ